MSNQTVVFGGKLITVTFEPVQVEGGFRTPPPMEMKVRHIPVREYDTGYKFVDDEVGLVGFLVSKDRAWALTVSPESYEEILNIGREENAKGFFSHCQRRTERDGERIAREQLNIAGVMATLPPEMAKTFVEMGLKLAKK